jgi:hypothetical protein
VSCYLAYLTWCTVTSTPDSEAAGRDPTEEYFNAQGIQVDLGPYHAGLDPYHDLDLPRVHVGNIDHFLANRFFTSGSQGGPELYNWFHD